MSYKLLGARIDAVKFTSCGNSTNHNGVGDTNISARRPGEWPWLDLGCIYFASPTPNAYTSMETARKENPYSEDAKHYADTHRRLSRTQAMFVRDEILKFLQQRFVDGIPSDEECKAQQTTRKE